jgi:hypothetical protein
VNVPTTTISSHATPKERRMIASIGARAPGGPHRVWVNDLINRLISRSKG